MSQSAVIEKFLMKFNMENCKQISTPMEKYFVGLLKEESKKAFDVPYREEICSLFYFSMFTRPYIAYSVGTLAKFCKTPTQMH